MRRSAASTVGFPTSSATGALVHRRPLLAALAAASLLHAVPAAAADGSWLAPSTLAASGPAAGAPRIAVNRGGDAVIVWVRGGGDPAVLASVRPSGTVDWPTPERLSAACPATPRGCSFADPRVAIDDDGDVAAAWVSDDRTGGGGSAFVQAVVRLAGSGGWTRPQTLSEVLGTRPVVDVGIDARGGVTAAWSDGDRAIRAATRPAGGSWSRPARLSGAQEAAAPELAVGTRGDALAVWSAGDCRPWAARRSAGGEWEPPLALEPEGACGDGPAPAVDRAGNAVAAWRHWTGNGRTLRVADLPAAREAWQTAADLGAAAAGALDPPPLAVGADGRAILVWKDEVGSVRYATRPPAGVWGPAQPVPGAAAGTVASIDFSLAANGDALIALGGGGGRPPRAVVRPPDAGWGSLVPIGPAPRRGFVLPVVAADGSGDAVAAWSELGSIAVGELTGRAGVRVVPRTPRVTRLDAPEASPASALVRLRATFDTPANDVPVTVEHLVEGAWVRLTTLRVTAAGSAEVPVRLLQPGTERLRVRASSTRPSAAVSVRVTRPGRRRLAVGAAPSTIAAGEGSIWVLGSDGGAGTVRRLDAATGRPLGRLIIVGGDPTAIAAGAGAVWVVRNGSELVRIDASSGAVGAPVALPGNDLSVTAGPRFVWVGGVCLPESRPAAACTRQAALRIDSATGAPDGWRALLPGARPSRVRLTGSTLWVWGPRDGGGATVVGRADAVTGALSATRTLPGRPAVVPLGPAAAWSIEGGRIATAWPAAGLAVHRSLGRSPSLVAAVSGSTAWTLERLSVSGGVRSSRLLGLDTTTGGVRGRPVSLGEASLQDERLAVTAGAVWVLRPLEGALLRIRVPAAG